jgi:hypothetical protein
MKVALRDMASDLLFVSFLMLSFVLPVLFAGRLAMALFSTDRVEACYIRNRAEGYVLIQQRRWQVIPQEVKFAGLADTLAAAKAVCPRQEKP